MAFECMKKRCHWPPKKPNSLPISVKGSQHSTLYRFIEFVDVWDRENYFVGAS
jgi:hypothetical protein